jgi:hypothetical protein
LRVKEVFSKLGKLILEHHPLNLDNKALAEAFENNTATAEDLANELADRPYGQKQDSIARATISLPASVLFKLEDMHETKPYEN